MAKQGRQKECNFAIKKNHQKSCHTTEDCHDISVSTSNPQYVPLKSLDPSTSTFTEMIVFSTIPQVTSQKLLFLNLRSKTDSKWNNRFMQKSI